MIEYLTNLISAYKYTVTPYSRGISLPKIERIRIDEENTSETFLKIFNLLTNELGKPIYTHSFFGHLWEKDGKIIAYAAIEESYKYVTINILSLNKIPRGRKMPYEKYAQLENAVKVLADKHSLKYCDNIAYNCINHSLNYLLQSNSKLLIITIKGNKIDYYISVLQREDDKISRMIPKGCDQKIINRKKFASINNALTEIFDELDEID